MNFDPFDFTGGAKRKREVIDFTKITDPEERAIEMEFAAQKQAKRNRKTYRPLVKYLQLLYEQRRSTDDPIDQAFLDLEIDEYEDELKKYDVQGLQEHSMYTDAGGESPTSGKKLRFGTPQLAFYKVDELPERTQLPRHSSLEELSRHEQEMSSAMQQFQENPRWYGGGRRKYL